MGRTDPVARGLVEAALELHRRRLWQEVPGDAPFLIRLHDEPAPLVATIMGHMGSEYGLDLVRGPDAFARTVTIHRSRRDRPDEVDCMSLLAVTMEPVGSLPPDARELLKNAGFHVGHDGLAPLFLAKAPHRVPRAPNRSEQHLLLVALRAVLAVHAAGEFRPRSLDLRRRRIFQIVATESGRELEARGGVAPWPKLSLPPPVETVVNIDVDPSLPRVDERWLATWELHPIAIAGKDRAAAILLVVEERQRTIVASVPLQAGDYQEAGSALACAFRGEFEGGRAGLPREIAFTSSGLQAALREALTELGIAVTLISEHPALDAVLDRLETSLVEIGRARRDVRRETEAIPATLEGWKAADHDFIEDMVEDLDARAPPERAFARYFGSLETAARALDELGRLQSNTAFIEWFVADFRATKRSLTYLERRLRSRETTALERSLIEARVRAKLSIFRVDATHPGATLDVEDVLDGTRATIHDRAFSGCDLEGFFIPLRLFRLGEWDTCVVAGPPLDALRLNDVLHRLEASGVELSPEGLRRSAHLTGRLWAWELDENSNPPMLCNTDGEPLELVTATFRIADVTSLQDDLRRRSDLDHDESEDVWVWSRPGGPAPGFGKTTLLARLQILGERLVVEVNSYGRLTRARKWIDRIPGVSWEGETRRDFFEPAPVDDQLEDPAPAAPIDAELRAQLVAAQNENCRRWLDTPVPALWNRTPRAACATEEGRRRVAIMIRTMPAMGVPGGSIAPPREELLRELGLNTEKGARQAGA